MRISLFLILVSAFGGVSGVVTGEVKVMSVMEGDSVTLNTCVRDIQKDSNIVWTYGPENDVLAKLNKGSQTSINEDVLDEMFRGRLKLDPQTGSLSIKNIRTGHSGLYTAEITSSKEGTSKRVFNVNVTGVFDPEADKLKSVWKNEGEPVTLNTGVTVKRDDLILWKFGQSSKHCVYDAVHNIPAIAKLYGETRETSLDAGEDQIFSGCLSLNEQTGDLTIRNTQTKHAGCYFLQINSNTGTRFRRFNVTVSARTEPAPRTHWEVTGPVFLVAAIMLGVIVMGLLSKKRVFKHCRKYKDSETTTQESLDVLNPSS
ncbi:uncharacterized protein LOC130548767 [Triplophysa rosa]|uniref:Immunoglobulin domain-containing protein n=1 Tax=Triplophysa rosa TaxID=992332 RepID=A0A9W7T6X6_TRIRA|nr:uncharacterized protein LOC130548767 [Triplophysa rosa]KAI7790809.1 hypothetical protein IRJ41_001904 [Triplophysa rosa]